MYIPFFKRFKNKECSFNTLLFGEVCMGVFWTFLNYLNPCFSDTHCYFSFLGYFMYILSVQCDHIIAFDPLSLTNPQRIMKTVPYKIFFSGKMCSCWTSQHSNLHLKTTGLFSSGLRWTSILPLHHLFKCRTLYLLVNMMLASK